MKSNENCFKNFNGTKVILNKRTNLQVMYVRDFRVSILACKDYKINTKMFKILFILLMLFFSVYRLLGLFMLCSHATKFSSSFLLSYIYINVEINNLNECAGRNSLLKTCGNVKFLI